MDSLFHFDSESGRRARVIISKNLLEMYLKSEISIYKMGILQVMYDEVEGQLLAFKRHCRFQVCKEIGNKNLGLLHLNSY